MFNISVSNIVAKIQNNVTTGFEVYLPKILGAVILIVVGVLISMAVYRLVRYIFKRFKILEIIDQLDIDFDDEEEVKKKKNQKNDSWEEVIVSKLSETFGEKIKMDIVIAKAFSYYVFLLFFRYAIVVIWVSDVEDFMGELLAYLPSLFIAFIIGFFGMRFANFVYDVSYHSLKLTKHKTAKIIASGCKIIVLFFTLMAVLSNIWIATEIITTILIGFISMLALAGWLAFGLGWKEIAKEILESLRK